jgi:catechol 2,3-dioxygenase
VIDPRVEIGHVHLKVADLERSLRFWRDILGFEVQARLGDEAAFLSAGGYHHHIGLNTWESRGGQPPRAGTTGLYHVAIRYPDRGALANAVRGVVQAGVRLDEETMTTGGRRTASRSCASGPDQPIRAFS